MSHTCVSCICLIATTLAVFPQTSGKMSEVEVRVFETLGKEIRSFEVTVTGKGKQDAILGVLSRKSRLQLPYGEYLVQGRASLYEHYERAVSIRRPNEILAVVFTPVNWGESEDRYSNLRGTVTNAKGETGLWVRLVSVLDSYSCASPIDELGKFDAQIPDGKYIVFVFRDGSVLASKNFEKTAQKARLTLEIQ